MLFFENFKEKHKIRDVPFLHTVGWRTVDGQKSFFSSEIVSIVKTKDADKEWKKIQYVIFDTPQVAEGFEKRLAVAKNWFKHHPNPHVEITQQEICRNQDHLKRKLKEIQSKGGEGLILRKPGSPYITGRSYDLLKVKRFDDEEATVIQHFKGKGRNADRLLIGSWI